jgi:ornithine--oxo-acid transaminase
MFEEGQKRRLAVTHGHTIRIAPPLVITSDQVDWALEGIGTTLRQDFS